MNCQGNHQVNIPFEGTASIMIGTTRNNKNFVKTENS